MADCPSPKLPDDADTSPAPRTPQPPFDPPKRFSSLAFATSLEITTPASSRLHDTASVSSKPVETPQLPQTNAETSRLLASSAARATPLQVHRVFQAARGALHKDMFAASSPASSIESRMNLEHNSSWQPGGSVGADTREWRYSTAPFSLATVSVDVREPLPSPTLPDVSAAESASMDEILEPASSGFASPTMKHLEQDFTESLAASSSPGGIVPASPCSGSHVSVAVQTPGSDNEAGVDQDLQRLQVDSDRSDEMDRGPSPTNGHLKSPSRRASGNISMQISPVNSIYLSESAEAAAQSAKAKRRWLKGIFPEDTEYEDEDGDVDDPGIYMGPQLPKLQVMCPDPMIHQIIRTTPCPEPSLHSQSPSIYRKPVDYYDSDVIFDDPEAYQMPSVIPDTASHRATSTGSPMPFPKLRSRPPTAYSERQSLRSPTPVSTRAQVAAVNEHFRPGWYYAREPIRPSAGPSYSFSTAASKAIGSDQAPDSRMRDSYKTDTLTALPVPTSRYRKNGIGAQVAPRGVGRYYERPSSAASAKIGGFRPRPSSRQTYNTSSEVRFRSSPPRGSGQDRFMPVRRKRAMDDSFMIAEDTYRPVSVTPEIRPSSGGGRMESNKRIDMAVRSSVFGGSTPEALRNARQGITELSPNVQLYRKGTHEHVHLRKKRRPSYWDNDLKEVRDSPAGRGGVQSPVSAQESMRAELEVASQGDTEMGYDEDALVGDVGGPSTGVSSGEIC